MFSVREISSRPVLYDFRHLGCIEERGKSWRSNFCQKGLDEGAFDELVINKAKALACFDLCQFRPLPRQALVHQSLPQVDETSVSFLSTAAVYCTGD